MSPAKPSHRILAGPALRVQPDGRLVTLAREGSERAVEEIVRRYRPALLRYAASIVPVDRADDVVQESLTRALPGIESSSEELHLRPWLYTIVRNTALNNLRDAGPPHEQLDENYDGVEQPPQAIDRRERVRALVASLQSLPDPQREALVKREMEGMSHSEIAMALGVSAGAARQLIFRARNALRDGLGLLVPMPVLRYMVERGTVAEAGAAGGGAIALKATVAMLATGAAVTAGVAIKGSDHHRSQVVADRAPGKTDSRTPPAQGRRSPTRSSDHESAGQTPAHRGHRGETAGSGAVGGDGVLAGHETRSGTQQTGGEPRGHDPSGVGSHHGSSPSGGGSPSGSGWLSGATEDGNGGQSSDDGPGAADSPGVDGGDSPDESSTDSGGSEPSGDGSGGSSFGDASSEPSPEADSETSSTNSVGQQPGDN